MKLYVIAGEASGDLHASALMKALKARIPDVSFRFWGGDEMAAVAGPPQKHIRDLAFMGFTEVVRHLPTILGNFKEAKRDILDFQPDALILVDYPGFNLRMAKWARKNGLRVVYYISPQLWAWHQSRADQIRSNVDQMLVILPFEKDFYASRDIAVEYVGHPLAERLKALDPDPEFRTINDLDQRPIIALLPGSRRQEIQALLPIYVRAAVQTQYQYIVAAAPSQDPALYASFVEGKDNIRVVSGQTYQLLLHAHSALVTSGTATLETALLKVPQIVCYKGSWLSYHIAQRVIRVSYISLVNLILDHALVPELIQNDLTAENIRINLEMINAGPERQRILQGYDKLSHLLGDQRASESAADLIIEGISRHG